MLQTSPINLYCDELYSIRLTIFFFNFQLIQDYENVNIKVLMADVSGMLLLLHTDNNQWYQIYFVSNIFLLISFIISFNQLQFYPCVYKI